MCVCEEVRRKKGFYRTQPVSFFYYYHFQKLLVLFFGGREKNKKKLPTKEELQQIEEKGARASLWDKPERLKKTLKKYLSLALVLSLPPSPLSLPSVSFSLSLFPLALVLSSGGICVCTRLPPQKTSNTRKIVGCGEGGGVT